MKRIYSERAHFMCPDMHFGIAAEINAAFDAGRLFRTVAALRDSHPLLSAVVTEDGEGNPVFTHKDDLEIPVTVGADASAWLDDYAHITEKGWDLRTDCLLRVIAYAKGGHTFIVFAAHHLLCDGMALLRLVQSAADLYAGEIPLKKREDRLIESQNSFKCKFALPFIVKCIVNSANKKWRAAGQRLSYAAFREFELKYYAENRTERSVFTVEKSALADIAASCKEKGVTVNDYLTADMMASEHVKKVVVGADIRKHIADCEEGALGNFSSAYSVEVRQKSDDAWKLVPYVSKAMNAIKRNPGRELLTLSLYSALDQELLDAAAASALGGFDSAAGLFVGDRLLGLKAHANCALTNLGKFESDTICSAYFIPPCSPSVRKIKGALTVNGTLRIVECAPHRD